MDFSGRVVLVTGGGSGIGRATAQAFGRAGATVVVAGRNAENLQQTIKLIDEAGGHADAVVADVTADAAWMVTETVSRHGGLHIAINNAGVAAGGTVTDLDAATWTWVIDTNLSGTWLAMKHEIEHMRANGGGTIVNVASNLGAHKRIPGLSAYIAAKAGVSALTRAAALEYIADNIRINAVSPGPADTPMSLRPGETPADRTTRMKTALPIGRVATLDEVTAAILWAAGDESTYMVGHDLVLDGAASA